MSFAIYACDDCGFQLPKNQLTSWSRFEAVGRSSGRWRIGGSHTTRSTGSSSRTSSSGYSSGRTYFRRTKYLLCPKCLAEWKAAAQRETIFKAIFVGAAALAVVLLVRNGLSSSNTVPQTPADSLQLPTGVVANDSGNVTQQPSQTSNGDQAPPGNVAQANDARPAPPLSIPQQSPAPVPPDQDARAQSPTAPPNGGGTVSNQDATAALASITPQTEPALNSALLDALEFGILKNWSSQSSALMGRVRVGEPAAYSNGLICRSYHYTVTDGTMVWYSSNAYACHISNGPWQLNVNFGSQ